MAQEPFSEMPVQRWARRALDRRAVSWWALTWVPWWVWAFFSVVLACHGVVEVLRADAARDVGTALVVLLLMAPAQALLARRTWRGQSLVDSGH